MRSARSSPAASPFSTGGAGDSGAALPAPTTGPGSAWQAPPGLAAVFSDDDDTAGGDGYDSVSGSDDGTSSHGSGSRGSSSSADAVLRQLWQRPPDAPKLYLLRHDEAASRDVNHLEIQVGPHGGG